ncbi:MAG TPA: SPFH domain-containing protein, partial [Acidothermaceae bacterium]|nr:SPFH domain-containing protein [Acidothermaceae bacterium]
TGKWGIRVNRVELKGIDPPPSIKDSMEKQMRADRDKRAAILTAEGLKQSQILTAEGEKQSSILRAEGQAKAATYEIANYIQGVEQLTVTTLRNVVGGMDLEKTLTSREEINAQLRGVLDEATGKWGIRVNRVELKSIDPPASIKDSMEKQMRADRDKRAAILTAEGLKQSQILTAEGEKQGAILRAEGNAQAAVTQARADAEAQALRAQGQSKAIETVFEAIHEGKPDAELLAYQYLQMLPQIAKGDANKLWIVPSEMGKALEALGGLFGNVGSAQQASPAGPAGPASSGQKQAPARPPAIPAPPPASASELDGPVSTDPAAS